MGVESIFFKGESMTPQPLLVGYGLTQALTNLANPPIVANRVPTVADKQQIGTIWIDKPAVTAYILVDISNNAANWVTIVGPGGAGVFFSLEATGGDITADVGNIIATLGNIVASAGNLEATIGDVIAGGAVTAQTGDITADAGNIVATLGNISAPAGTITADGNITSTAGSVIAEVDLQAITGDIVADAGDVIVTAGDITVTAGSITATAGDIVATAGVVRANVGGFVSSGGDANVATVVVTGDTGSPVANNIQFSNVVDTTQGAGALTLLSTTANPGTNTGFFKIYVGVTTCWVPYFDDIAP